MRNTIHPNCAQESLRGMQGAFRVGVSQYDTELLAAVASREIAAARYRLSERGGRKHRVLSPASLLCPAILKPPALPCPLILV